MLTQAEVEQALPPALKSAATQQLVDLINNASADPMVAEQIRNNFISYTSVLKLGKFKTEDYLNAVSYVSFKMMGYSNQDAYIRTFPARYQQLLANGTSSRDIASHVSSYHRGKLVNLVMEQTMVPTWVLNQDIYQKAINVQYEIMKDDQVSPKVRVEAANSLLTHLKRPETKEVNLNLGVSESSGMRELQESLRALALQQTQLIESGVSTKLIAGSRLAVDAEFVEVDVDQAEPGRVAG